MAHPASPRAFTRALVASTALVGVGLVSARAEPLPTGGQVVSGAVTIGTPQGNALAITQSSQTAIVNWQGFSVGQGHRVDIHQPNAGAAILNRVTGQTRSTIAGQLNANGQVYLVNPNGVTITRSGQVNAAGFVASSLGITDEDFKAGRRRFRGSGASAPVTNHGAITIGRGGYAALIGGQVTNTGTISVPLGRVGLGSGERATLDLSGDGFLQVAVPTKASGRGALVRHSGTISADGGAVMLSAAAARDMARQAVNLSGVVEARSVAGHNGSITLSGDDGAVAVTATARLDASGLTGADGGRVRISGRRLDVAGTVEVSGATGGRARLKASEHLALSGRVLAEGRTGRGGRVVATAPTITTHAALIDAAGVVGGGVVRVGGGRLGQGPLARAERVTADAASTIRADATGKGDGGDVVVWSDVATRFAGTITARGGAQGGNGGEVEVSSKGVLSYDGHTILTAAKGSFGTLLLDPYNITIANAADSGTAGGAGGFTANANDSVLGLATLQTALANANVTVSTGGAGSAGTQAGNITLAAGAPLAWNSGATLTLQAAGAVTLNSAITAPAGGLRIEAGASAPSTATADLAVARFTLASGNWVQNAATLPGFATGDFQVAGGSFLRAAGGSGTTASPYRLTDIYGVQGMGTSSALLSANYRLAGDVDATGTAAWNGGAGFSPVGPGFTGFTGSLDGAGRTITGLTIARPRQDFVGLIGTLGTGGRVSGLGLVGASVTGGNQVGGLVGFNSGTMSQSYVTGSVSGGANVGGLIGNSRGPVSQSYASGSVSGRDYVGGLVGTSTGAVSQSYASGSVSGSVLFVGGLVGYNNGAVSQSYASGSVSGSGAVGGLVGSNRSTVSQSYASGSVSVLGTGSEGGLVGSNSGTLANAYWDTQTTGRANGVGGGPGTGATGLTTAQARTASSYTGFDFGSVWYQAGDMRPILRSQAAAAGADGVIPVSNLNQLQLMGANLAGLYRLTANLDASATNATAASPGVWGAGGFVPVGTDTAPFTGSLDGAGRTITGLTIARPSQVYVGLVGYLGGGGNVSGLGLVGGSVSGGYVVGGLIGYSDGTVSQSYASGSVSGKSRVGGLVGQSNGTVSQSYAGGSVSGSRDYVGGLIGYNRGTVSQSYASGSVSGDSFVGGLVGYSASTVSQSYASGGVTGSSAVGGLVGVSDGTLTNAYWDTQTTGQANGVGGGSGSATSAAGLTAAQARTGSSYAGFDFGTVWYQAGDMRPILRAEAATADANGVIAVSNLNQLQLMGANLSGRYRLTANLDASATNATAASPDVWGAGGFVSVGTGSTAFTGSLDGAGRTITGLTITRPGQDYVGLIGALGRGGSLSGLGLVGGSILGNNGVGGLVGYSLGAVSQSYTSGSVSGGSDVGGLVGRSSGTVSQSYTSGSVSGTSYVGGLVGQSNGTVSQSYAGGSVSGSNDTVGGLVGYNRGTVSQSYASGSVSGSSRTGGLIGYNNGTLTNAYWDTQTTGRANGVGSGSAFGSATSVAGRTTAQMQDLASFQTNYAGFDFATVWAPPNQAGQGGQGTALYPQLYGLSNVVTVAPTSSRVYGAGQGPIATYAGVRPGDFVTTLGSLTTSATATSDVGRYAVTASGTALTSPAGNAYRVVSLPGTLSITPATIIVAGATGVDKTYDRSTALPGGSPGFTSSGVLFGDAVTVSAGSALYDSAAAGTRSVNVSGLTLGGAKAGNYVLSATAVTGSGTIDRAVLALTGVTANNKIYDGITLARLGGSATISPILGDVVGLSGSGTGIFADKNAGVGKAVTVTGYGLTGADAGNYSLVQPAGLTANITRANLTVSGISAARKTYDGTTAATLVGTATVTPIVGDAVSLSGTGTATFVDKNVGVGKAVTAAGYTLAGADAANYSIVQPIGLSANITRASLAVSGVSAANKIYDGITAATLSGTAVVSAFGGDAVTLTGAGTATFADKNAGTGKAVIVTGYGLTGADAANYSIVQPAGLTANITKASLTVSGISATSKTYDSTTAATLVGTATVIPIGGDAVWLTGTGTGTFADKNAGTGKAVTATGYGLTGADAGNYTLVTPPNLSADITRASLDVFGLRVANKAYDGTTAATLLGTAVVRAFVGDAISLSGTGTATFADKNAGSGKAVTATGYTLTGADAGNYRIVQPVGLTANIVRANLDVSGLSAANKTYDGTTAATLAGTASVTAIGADAISLSGVPTATFASKNVGSGIPVTLSGLGLTGADADNYSLLAPALSADISPATLTYTAALASRTYGAANPAVGGTVSGFAPGENLGSATTGTLAFGTAAATSSNVGAYAVTGGGLTATNGNYVFAQAAGNDGALTVTPALLSVTGTRTYDATTGFRTGQLTVVGGVNGETVTLTAGSGSTVSADAGTYGGSGLTGLSLSVAGGNGSAANYRLPATATLAITAAPVIVTARSGSSVYGDTPTDPGLSATGLQGGQDVGVLTGLSNGFGIDATTGAGRYGLMVVGALSNGNYTISTRTVGAWQVDPRPLTLTANAQTRVYGNANSALTYTLGGRGLVNGDTLSGGLATAADAASGVGSYAIGQGTLGASANYAVSYTGANLTVVQRAIILTADAQTRVYGEANPALTYRVGGRGLVNGDALTGTLATAADARSNVGTYAISQGTIDAPDNYAVSYVGANLTVAQRAITVTAAAQNRTYGDANPSLTYTLGGRGLVNGDTLSGGLTTSADAASGVGSYAITRGTLGASANYALTYVGSALTIGQRAITVTADRQDRVYGDANPSLTYTLGGRGLVNGDGLGGALVTDANAASGVGRYAIGQGSLAASANYAVTYQGADLTVTPRPVALSGTRVYDAGTGIVGGLLTVENRVNGDTVAVSGTGTLAGPDVGSRAITDVAGLALSNANYTLAGASGGVTITPATLTYVADAARRTYGAVNPALTGTVTGFLGTDTLADATTGSARFTTAAGTGSHVGAYAVTGAGLSSGNYVLVQAAANADALTIDPAALTVAGTKTYDATTDFGFGRLTVSGGVNSETVTLTAGAGTAASADAGTYGGSSLTGLRLSVSGGSGSAANYRLPTTGTLAITPATVDLRVNDGRSVYGDRPVDPGFSASGLVGGQSVDVLTGLSTGFGLDAASAAGRTTLTVAGRLTNGNYRIGSVTAGIYTIDRRPITVTADTLGRVYGDADPTLTYTIGGRGLANGDRLTGALATAAGRRSDVGTYAIGQGTLAASANYALTYREAELAVIARPITVLADPQTRYAGTANPSLTYTVGGRGLVAGDRLTGTLATTAEADSEPGLYRINQGSLTASANYALGFVGADLTVLAAPTQPRPLPVALDAGRFASTAERVARLDARPVNPELPLLLGAGTDGRLVAADPRFDATLVCTASQGGCFLAPPVILTAPSPRAGLSDLPR